MLGMSQDVTPVPGMGATLPVGSDRYPYTITRVSPSGHVLWAKRDDFAAAPGHRYPTDQQYIYSPDPRAIEIRFTLSKNGWVNRRHGRLQLGERRAYLDPDF
jgi:hypothetical protein